LVDLAAVGVVEVLDALLSMGSFTFNVGSGCFPPGARHEAA